MFNAKKVLIFDGAVGTALYDRGFYINRPFEELCLNAPEDVVALHKSYIQAGADVITTNSFSATKIQLKKYDIENQQQLLISSAIELANKAREGSSAKIAFSIGPMGELIEPLGKISLEEVFDEYADIARMVQASESIDCYILETFGYMAEMERAIEGIRSVDKTTPILASLTVLSTSSRRFKAFADRIGKNPMVQALGLNCSEGPSGLFTCLRHLRPLTEKPIIVQPNSGMPRNINGRYFYMTSPDYLAKYAKRYVEAGANGVGGCCGTNEHHIAAIRQALLMTNVQQSTIQMGEELKAANAERRPLRQRVPSNIGQALCAGEKVITVELSPPKGIEIEKFEEKVQTIKKAGVRFINVPDGARASTKASSLHIASYYAHKNCGISILPHFTTRDRNLIALQSDLLGAHLNGVRDLLLVTGDPPKLGNNKDASAVYDLDSIGLTRLVDCLNKGLSPLGGELGSSTDYGIGVASNPTAMNMELEVKRWNFKCEMGADFAVTQPVYDPESYLKWRELTAANSRPHIVGIWPFISLRNAEFMANEVPGVTVPQWALDEMEKAGDDKEEAIKRGVEIAQRVISALDAHCEGFAISAPLGKVDVALRALGKE
ncbi:bifunctional homocysteine S-methyltransferase/methylenetetrahydrofolate reductase [bacterium]|nr:bifunctional homocysteine S-methyltransferase/methylenetetrahydrofolate reductase [bacterium]